MLMIAHGHFTSQKKKEFNLLEKLYESYKKRWNDIAEAITMEMGAPKDFSTKLTSRHWCCTH